MVKKCTICNQVVNCDDIEEHIKDKHSDKECEMCHKKFKQEEIEKHRERCECKMEECQFCGLKVEKKELFEHEYECGAKTELCTKCGKFIPLRDMIDHQNKICVDILIYEGQGKKELIKRNVNLEDSLTEEEDKKEIDKNSIQKENQRNEVREINRINRQEDNRQRRNEITNERYQIREREECVDIDSLKEQYDQMNDVFNRLNDFNMNLYNEINHSHHSSHSKHGNQINKPDIDRLVNKYSKNNDKQYPKKKYSNIMDNRHYNYQEPKKAERKEYNYEREHLHKYEDKNKSKNIERPQLERIPFENKFIYNKYKPMNEDYYYRKQIPEKEVSNHSNKNHKKVVQPVNRINSQKKENTKPRSIRHQSQPSQNRRTKEVNPFEMGKYMDDYLPDDVFE